MNPDRVVIGVESQRGRDILSKLYAPLAEKGCSMLFMDIASAEMTKYAANAMLATRISFMNDIANLCDLTGADVEMVRRGIGSDCRIGNKFLAAGCGYGGSCFPKDVKALIRTAYEYGDRMRVIEAVEAVNEQQKTILVGKLYNVLGNDLCGKTIAIWGLSFKPETDDMREAPALVIIDRLIAAGASVKVYDPVAMSECRRRIGNVVAYCGDMYETVAGADALLLVTEWEQFRTPLWPAVKRAMRQPILIDGRNIYDKQIVTDEGFRYYAVGRPDPLQI